MQKGFGAIDILITLAILLAVAYYSLRSQTSHEMQPQAMPEVQAQDTIKAVQKSLEQDSKQHQEQIQKTLGN